MESVEIERDDRAFSTQVLREVVERLSDPSAVFTLYVHEQADEKVVYFVGGGVRLLSTGPRGSSSLADHLLEKGFLPVETLHEVLEESRRTGHGVREVLLERGVISRDDLTALTNRLIRDQIMDLVFWSDARYELFTGAPPEELYSADRAPLVGTPDIDALIADVVEWSRRWDALRQRLHSDLAVLELTAEGRKVASEPFAGSNDICERIGEGTTLRGLARSLGIEVMAACDLVLDLLDRGLARVQPPERRTGRNGLLFDIEVLESSLAKAIGRDRVHARLAQLYEQCGDRERAAAHRVALADLLVRQESWARAVEHLKHALTLTPRDLQIFARAAKILAARHLLDVLHTLAANHAHALVEQGDAEIARTLSRELVKHTGDRRSAETLLANAMSGKRPGSTGVEQYLRLADEYHAAGQRKKAVEMLRQALRLAPEHPEALAKLARIDPELAAAAGAPRARLESKVSVRRRATARPARPPRPLLGLGILLGGALAVLAFAGFVLEVAPRLEGAGGVANAQSLEEDEAGIDSREASSTARESREAARSAAIHVELDEDHGPSVSPNDWIRFAADAEAAEKPTPTARHRVRTGDEILARGGALPVLDDITPTRDGGAAGRDPAHPSSRTSRAATTERARSGSPSIDARPRDDGVVRRKVDGDRHVIYGRARDFELWDSKTGRRLARLGARPESRWTISREADLVCRWQPGEACELYSPRLDTRVTSPWKLPDDAEAVAISVDFVVVRRGDRTSLYDLDGNPRVGARLPAWSEGFFARGGLVLLRPHDDASGHATLWLVDPATLEIEWSIEVRDGALSW